MGNEGKMSAEGCDNGRQLEGTFIYLVFKLVSHSRKDGWIIYNILTIGFIDTAPSEQWLVFKSPVKSSYWVPNMVTETVAG